MALPPRGERLPSEMNEGTDYGYKGHKGPTYGLGALGLLGLSPSAQFLLPPLQEIFTIIYLKQSTFIGYRPYSVAGILWLQDNLHVIF
jgi:hypothetical protein